MQLRFFLFFQCLVSTIDFRYITDVITPTEAIAMLKAQEKGKATRIADLIEVGYPAYTTQVGKYPNMEI